MSWRLSNFALSQVVPLQKNRQILINFCLQIKDQIYCRVLVLHEVLSSAV